MATQLTEIALEERIMNARWGWLLVPSLLIFSGLLIASQFQIVHNSFYEDLGLGRVGKHFGFTNYIAIFRNPFYLSSIWITLKVSALATFVGLLFAYPVAYTIARMRSKWGMVMLAGVLLASFITVPIKVLGLVILFSKEGLLNQFLLQSHLINEPVTILGNQTGVVVGLIYYSMAFAVLLLYSVIRTIPVSLEEAAKIHGCGLWRAFWRVVFPLSVPGLITVGMTMFNLSMGGFAAAALIGAGRVLTIPVLIYQTIFVEAKYAIASTLSVILMLLVILVNIASLAIIAAWRGRLRRQVSRLRSEPNTYFASATHLRLGAATESIGDTFRFSSFLVRSSVSTIDRWLLERGIRIRFFRALNILWMSWIYFFLLAPLGVVALASLNGGSSRAGSITVPPHQISFDWYLQTPASHLKAFGASVVLATVASLVALLLALPVGIALARGEFRNKELIAAVLRMPLQIPFVIVGISFLYLYIVLDKNFGLSLPNTIVGLVLAHVFILTPYVVGSVTAVVQRLNVQLEEAARVHGASRWRTFCRVTLPVIMPGIFAGTIYAFMVSFGDVPIALFLAGPSFVPLPMLIYQSMQVDFDATLLSTSTVVMVVGLGLLLLVQWLIGLDSLAREAQAEG